MHFENPGALWLLLLLLPLAWLYAARFRADRPALRRLAGRRAFPAVYSGWMVRSFFGAVFSLAALALLAVALADPRGGTRLVADERSGLDVAFVLDVSRSMLATDTPPSRLAAATAAASRIAAALPAARVAVVAFKGAAYRLLPLTDDPEALRLVLSVAGPDVATSAGSDLEAGIREALASLHDAGRYRAMVVFSDGESLSGDPVKAAREARAAGVPVLAVAVGTTGGVRLVLPDGRSVFDTRGRPVVSRLERRRLEDIAAAGGGRVYGPEETAAVARDLLPLLKGLGAKEWTQGVRAERVPLFRLFTALALAGLALSRLVRSLRLGRLGGAG